MIKSISLIKKDNTNIKYSDHNLKSTSIDLNLNIDDIGNAFSLRIEFENSINLFRNHDYNWTSLGESNISNWYSPKILKLESGVYIQSNLNIGIWETNPKEKDILLWHFNVNNAKPRAVYDGANNQKKIENSKNLHQVILNLKLLFSKNGGLEFSRSVYPFSAIACFTDHCDFDTIKNLKLQREFFEKYNIKTTKGIFLNDFSKRENASYEKNSEELLKWQQNGHELAYHSLSQSIKKKKESFKDFEDFIPVNNIVTWIDHGFQPYNLSLFQNNSKEDNWFANNLKSKGIGNLWNYIDSGISIKGVINQINSNQFTLSNYYNRIKHYSLTKRLQLIIKVILFHFYGQPKVIELYKGSAASFKSFNKSKNFKFFFSFVLSQLKLLPYFFKIVLFWKSLSKKKFPLAEYGPLIYTHKIADNKFYIFQTIEMNDFINGLSNENIDSLIQESGVFIAHTYFSVDHEYHKGRMFKDANKINTKVEERFAYLSRKINENKVWNPTLYELIEYFKNIEKLEFDIDEDGSIFIKNNSNLHLREVV